jgi:hypothetical protein
VSIKYNPGQVIVTFNGIEIKGFAEGTFIEVATGEQLDALCELTGMVSIDEQRREYVEKIFANLEVGDVVFSAHYNGSWQDIRPYVVKAVTANYIYGRPVGAVGGDDVLLGSTTDTMGCRVQATKSTKQSSSQWNGKCPKCNRGTYTGFASVEHEGGRCDK